MSQIFRLFFSFFFLFYARVKIYRNPGIEVSLRFQRFSRRWGCNFGEWFQPLEREFRRVAKIKSHFSKWACKSVKLCENIASFTLLKKNILSRAFVRAIRMFADLGDQYPGSERFDKYPVSTVLCSVRSIPTKMADGARVRVDLGLEIRRVPRSWANRNVSSGGFQRIRVFCSLRETTWIFRRLCLVESEVNWETGWTFFRNSVPGLRMDFNCKWGNTVLSVLFTRFYAFFGVLGRDVYVCVCS